MAQGAESWRPSRDRYDSPGDDTFFDVFSEKRIIDDGDAGFSLGGRPVVDNGEPGYDLTEALWLELLGR